MSLMNAVKMIGVADAVRRPAPVRGVRGGRLRRGRVRAGQVRPRHRDRGPAASWSRPTDGSRSPSSARRCWARCSAACWWPTWFARSGAQPGAAGLAGGQRAGLRRDDADAVDRSRCFFVYVLSGLLNLGVPDSGARYPASRIHAVELVRDFERGNRTLWRDRDGGLSLAVTTIFWGVGATLQFAVLRWAADVHAAEPRACRLPAGRGRDRRDRGSGHRGPLRQPRPGQARAAGRRRARPPDAGGRLGLVAGGRACRCWCSPARWAACWSCR